MHPPRNIFVLLAVLLCAAEVRAQSSYTARTIAGSDQVGDGGVATAALLAQVQGVAVDGAGNIYVADADGQRVRKVAANGLISTVAGDGHAGFSGDGGPAASARLNTPYGVAVDRAGNVYIADLGNARVRRVSREGVISTVAGGGLGAPASEGGSATGVALNSPRNVAVDGQGNIYFSDFGAHRVFEVTAAGALVPVAGNGTAGFAGDGGFAVSAQLNAPAGLAVDSAGTVYIADSGNGRVRKVVRGAISSLSDGSKALALGTPTAVALDAEGGLVIADPGAAQIVRWTAQLPLVTTKQMARDVAVDAAGNVISCAGGFVYRRSRAGVLTTLAGSGSFGYGGDGLPAILARLNVPSGGSSDGAGNVYIADSGNHRVRWVTATGAIVTLAGSGVAGSGGDGGLAVFAQLNAPLAVVADGRGSVYIADTGNHRVRKVGANSIISTIAGSGMPGYAGDNGAAGFAQLNAPSGLALDAQGALYIADASNHVIRRIGVDGIISTVAGNGRRGFAGDDGPPLAASFDSPRAVAVDAAGTLFVADSGNHRIRRVPRAGVVSTVPQADAALWKSARGIAVDDRGNLFVSDAGDQRVLRIDSSGHVMAIAGDGEQGFNSDLAGGLATRLDTPAGIWVDAGGRVMVADSGNGRVRMLTADADPVEPAAVETPLQIVNGASLVAGPIAAGEIVSILGATPVQQPQVLFNRVAGRVLMAADGQLNVQVPDAVEGAAAVDVQVLSGGVSRARFTVNVVAAAPGLFAKSNGLGPAIATNEDGAVNSVETPAARGSVVTLYGTGEGRESGGVPVQPVAVRIGDYAADVLFAGAAPKLPGVLQVNARVPAGFAPSGTLPVVVQVGPASTQAGVTLEVR